MKFKVTKIEHKKSEMYGYYYCQVYLEYEDGTKSWFEWNSEFGSLTKRKIAKEARELYNDIKKAERKQIINAERIEQSKRFVGQKLGTARSVKGAKK